MALVGQTHLLKTKHVLGRNILPTPGPPVQSEEGELPRAAVKGRLGGSFVFPIALGAELTLLQLRQELFLERGLHCQVSTDH